MAREDDVVVRSLGLTKVFRDFWLREKVTAVRELDLSIRNGEVYGLLGPNGSGKSTTLKMILGLMFPTRGRVAVFGRAPTDVGIKSRIGFLPEESYLYPFLDARETLDYYGRLFHQPRRERRRRIDMLLDMVGLTGMSYRRVGEYSKGMQRRIGMAQALINDPDLLILDEPTSGMDPLAARQFKDLIAELSRRGKTVVLSSHLLADMEDVCDRVGILFAGELRSEGTLGELLARRGMTQITTERLDEQTTRRVLEVLDAAGKRVLSVESPKDKLEALFLRIVRQAQGRRARSAEDVRTGELAGFLRAQPEEKPEQVIQELVAAAQPTQPAPEPATAPPAPPEPSRQVLQELVDKADKTSPPEPASQQHPPAPAAPRQREQDRGVIEELIRRSQQENQENQKDA